MAILRMTLALVATLTFAQFSNACFCNLRHPQEIYCSSDFVAVLEVLNMEEIYGNTVPRHMFPMEVNYTVNIGYVFKRTDAFSTADRMHLYTGGSDGTCRVDLEVDKSYIVMGYVSDGKLYFGLCDWTLRSEELTEHVFRGLHYHYRRGCNCEIQKCYGDEQCNALNNQNNTCPWRSSNQCDVEYGFCREGPDSSCAWRSNRMRRSCLNRSNDVY